MLVCSVLWKKSIPFSYAERFARSVLMCDCLLQMSDERRSQLEQQAPLDEATQPQLPPPPLMSIEQMFLM
jgi:hypothetical protein